MGDGDVERVARQADQIVGVRENSRDETDGAGNPAEPVPKGRLSCGGADQSLSEAIHLPTG